ncbi:MAG: macro domain-containing protein [Thermoplasmata archaeon]|nr:macro domain-containing protein [Thermoplasmata archaeon]
MEREYSFGGVKLLVKEGDITAEEVDAIVNAANNHFWMGGGVAGAIKRRGGAEIEREAVSKGPVPVGEAVVTGAGRLKARYVIHAAVMGQDLATDGEKVRRAALSALKVARESGVKTIAFPALGCGVGGLPYGVSVKEMLRALEEFIASGGELDEVRLVMYGEVAYREAAEAVEVYLSEKD